MIKDIALFWWSTQNRIQKLLLSSEYIGTNYPEILGNGMIQYIYEAEASKRIMT